MAQEQNIGALANLNLLLSLAETEYFMWLADDDEISPNYLAELVSLLDNDFSTVTAAGQWIWMQDPHQGYIHSQLRPVSKNRLCRLLPFIVGPADDSAFYGLHRTDCLRRCNFGGYLPPNRGVLTNWCYLFLFDMLWQGRFAYSDKAAWIYHNYSEKYYDRALANDISDKVRTLLRRANIFLIYVIKSFRRDPFILPIISFASLVGFTRETLVGSLAIIRRTTNRRVIRGLLGTRKEGL